MRRLLCLLLCALRLIVPAGEASGQAPSGKPTGQRFVAVAFHDVADQIADLDSDAVTGQVLTQFFDWLKGTGWTAVSHDDLAAAAAGVRPLPDKAILLTADDGYRSLYTRVFPLLKVYRYPLVAALVGTWMESRPDGTVLYGERTVPREKFITWDEAREMQSSGLVEFASHGYALHRGESDNPQGSTVPAVVAWRYDPETGRYENDAEYRARIRDDLGRSRALMAAELGHPPRALVWPYGRYTEPALALAKAAGFSFALTLEPEPASTADLYAIHRYFPSRNPGLADLVRNLRFEPGQPTTRRVACVTLDAMAAAGTSDGQDAWLGHMIEDLRSLGANLVVIDAHAALSAPGAPLGEVFFPTRLRPLRADILSRATWQIRTRGDAEVFLRLPLAAAIAALGEAQAPELFADMARAAVSDGVVVDVETVPTPTPIAADLAGDARQRRAALDLSLLTGSARTGLAAYRAAAAIDPRKRLMLAMHEAAGPPDWADLALLPPLGNAKQTVALAARLRGDGWLRPDAAGRVILSLPADAREQVAALRGAQRQGAAAFALCPQPPALPPSPALAAAFSAATYPYRP